MVGQLPQFIIHRLYRSGPSARTKLKMKTQSGLTLVELMVTLAVAIVLLAVGVPTYRSMVANNAIVAQTNGLVSALNLARSEAVKRGGFVAVCPKASADVAETDCGGNGDWANGWHLFTDDTSGSSGGAGGATVGVAVGRPVAVGTPVAARAAGGGLGPTRLTVGGVQAATLSARHRASATRVIPCFPPVWRSVTLPHRFDIRTNVLYDAGAMLPHRSVSILPAPALDRQAVVDPLSIEVAEDLCSQLRNLAFAEGQSPQVLGQRLLARALEQEIRRARTERTLDRLTARQQEVAWLVADGSTNRQIAETLVISTETVKTHVANVLERLGLRSKAELRLLLLELGLPPKPERRGPPGIQGPFRLAPLASRREQVRRTSPETDPDRRPAGEANASR